MKTARDFFSPEQEEDIRLAIRHAELDTSGEIRVHIDSTCHGDVMNRAAYIFKVLEMHKTERRNGILFYLALKNRKFAILGDAGINAIVPPDFWDEIKTLLIYNFRDNKFTDGLIKGIEMTGKLLKQHFPHERDDLNELPDDISFGDR